MNALRFRAGWRIGAVCAVFAIAAVAAAQDTESSLESQKANIVSDRAELAIARTGDMRTRLRAFLATRGFDRPSLDSLFETHELKDTSGRRFARFEQRIAGLRVYGAYVKAAYDTDGDLIHVIERTAPLRRPVGRAIIKPADALRVAIDRNFGTIATVPRLLEEKEAISRFAKTDFFHQEPKVERVIIARGQILQQGFLVEIWSETDNQLYHTLVDSFGEIVSNELRTNTDTYHIFPIHPGVTAQTIVAGPGAGNAQSPAGWLAGAQRSISIQGNNVRAYLDRNNNNAPDSGGVAITDGAFVTPANLAQQPTTVQNQDVAVQNLFYLNNIIHDTLYQHGFVEGAGNFQEDNFSQGGRDSDSVDAEAQDGGGTNNANFATPSDGSNPRMQMYLWTFSSPQRDGDIDSDIVWHEYGHGLTWRMIGSMSGDVSGAIGEGMSDVLAIIKNNDDRVGEYSFNNPFGIRSAPYGSHPDTIGDFVANRGVHRNGEIYAAALWDMWQGYQAAGFARSDLMDDIVAGMNFTPAGPDYFEMRDGLLAAAPTARNCPIWEAFAGRGMGEGGAMSVSFFSVRITESFTVPDDCAGSGEPPPPPPPAGSPVLAGLTAISQTQTRFRWMATMTATVADPDGTPIPDIIVSYETDSNDRGTCTTNADGACSATVDRLSVKRDPNVTFTVTALDGDPNAEGVPRSVTVLQP